MPFTYYDEIRGRKVPATSNHGKVRWIEALPGAVLHYKSARPMWQKLSRCYPPQLEVIPLLLLLLALFLALHNYSSLPEKIPTHFDLHGNPDEWSGRNMIFLLFGSNAFVYILFSVFNIWLAIAKDPRSLMNLPGKRKAALSQAQIERLRLFLNRCLFLMKILMQGMMTYLLYNTIEVAFERARGLGAPFFLILATLLGLAGVMVWTGLRITRVSRQD